MSHITNGVIKSGTSGKVFSLTTTNLSSITDIRTKPLTASKVKKKYSGFISFSYCNSFPAMKGPVNVPLDRNKHGSVCEDGLNGHI